MTYPNSTLTNIQDWHETRANQQNKTATFLEFADDEKTEIMEQQSWQQLRAKAQNQTATLLDIDDDDDEDLTISSQQESWQKLKTKNPDLVTVPLKITNKEQQNSELAHQENWLKIKEKAQKKSRAFSKSKTNQKLAKNYKYKLISISKIEQLKSLQHLIPLGVRKQLEQRSQFLNLRGIIAQDSQTNFALILVDVSGDNRIAKTIHLSILPNYFDRKVGRRLVQCLTKSLPKINCDRLRLNKQARLFI